MVTKNKLIKRPKEYDGELSPREAMELYIELEIEAKELLSSIHRAQNKAQRANLRRKRKLVRTRQNMLYPIMVNTGYIGVLNERLNVSKQTLYRRYKDQFGSFDVSRVKENKDEWEQLDGAN